MKRINQIAALLFLALGLYMLNESRHLKVYTSLGPGAGFLPFWVGIALTLLALVWLVEVSVRRQDPRPADFVPDRAGRVRIISILGALVLCALLMDRLGFSLSMLGFLGFLLLALGRQNLGLTLIIAVAGSFGVNYVFATWLGVYLPKSSIAFLKGFGL